MSENSNGDLIVKVVLIGSSMVGKTSIVSRIMKNEFTDQPPTVGVSFVTHFIYLNNHNQVRLQIWDTAGDERFKAVTPMYYKDCNVAMIVYAINDHNSFEAVKEWISNVLLHSEVEPLLFIVGNKIDLESNQVSIEEEAKLEKDYPNAILYKVSAKESIGVFELFDLIAEKAVETNHIRIIDQSSVSIPKDNENKNETSPGCC